jgi:DNA-binding response OmpR family regulator
MAAGNNGGEEAVVNQETQGSIMVVDDQPANLRLMENMLRRQGYAVRSFPRGRMALTAAGQQAPDLILLDINMPEMNGYEVCERLKSDPRLAAIPVIFLSALDATEDKVKAFRSGGVDYVSKPFQFEEVQARVETHLQLRRAQRAERDLLEKTLNGVVSGLCELVQITSPVLALRSRAIRDMVRSITREVALDNSWQYEVAATLCLVGCITLPEDVFERCYAGENPSSDEEQMFRAHPATAARQLLNIPRLETVAEMIRNQQAPEGDPSLSETVRAGARMLHLALELDRGVFRGASVRSALDHLKMSPARFDRRMLDALANYTPARTEFELRWVPIRELRAGMILEKDVLSGSGNVVILKEGTVLTETWIERLGNFAKLRGAVSLVPVRISSLTGPGKLSRPEQDSNKAGRNDSEHL